MFGRFRLRFLKVRFLLFSKNMIFNFTPIFRHSIESGMRDESHAVDTGGIGSASQAMAAGIPQLIRPQAHDQFDNALRIVKLGIGDCLKPRNFNPKSLAKKLQTIIECEVIADRCKRVAEKMNPSRGLQQAVDVLESLN